MLWPWNPGQGSVKVIGHVTIRYSAYDFLLTLCIGTMTYLVSFLRYSMSTYVVTLKSESEVTQGHWKWYHSIDCVWLTLPRRHCRKDIRLVTGDYTMTLKPGLRVTHSYDFLLTFHSNHGPISYRFRDKRRFQSKIAKKNFPFVYFVPCWRVPIGIGYRH